MNGMQIHHQKIVDGAVIKAFAQNIKSDNMPTREEMREYYKTEEWKRMRDLCSQIHGFMCEKCGMAGTAVGGIKTLHAHHKTYDNFRNEQLEDLMCVCKQCHSTIHKKHRKEDVDYYI